jgi:cytochrome c oxidase subunit 2
VYHGQCAQLCGRQHAFMTALVNVLTPDEYLLKMQALKAAIQAANARVTQLRQYLLSTGNLGAATSGGSGGS